MPDYPVHTQMITSFDGCRLAVHRVGEGHSILLLHGLFSSAEMNWVRFGHAARLASAGFEAIMPDLRAHGASEAPHRREAYPADVLVRDIEVLVSSLSLTECDLAGFSLGSRTAAAAVVAGLRPRGLVLSGMGLEGLSGWARRRAFFIDAIDRFDTIRNGDPAFMAASFMKTMKVDRVAARLLLESIGDLNAGDLARITVPTLVLCGEDDQDNGSASALAEALPDAQLQLIPGTHMSSVTRPELGAGIATFLARP